MTTSLPDVYSMPLDAIDVSDPKIYQDEVWQPYFERLRQEARLSLGGPPPADLLVRCRDLQCPCAGIAGAFGTGKI